MNRAMHRAWNPAIDSLRFGKRRASLLFAGLAITLALLAGVYATAAALATTMAATFNTDETTWQAHIVEFAPAATPDSAGRGSGSAAERTSLGMGSVRWQTDATDIPL